MSALNATMTQVEFIAHLESRLAITPSNVAIQMHLAEVTAQSAVEFQAHKDEMFAPEAQAAKNAAIEAALDNFTFS